MAGAPSKSGVTPTHAVDEPVLEMADIQGIAIPGFFKPQQVLLYVRTPPNCPRSALNAFQRFWATSRRAARPKHWPTGEPFVRTANQQGGSSQRSASPSLASNTWSPTPSRFKALASDSGWRRALPAWRPARSEQPRARDQVGGRLCRAGTRRPLRFRRRPPRKSRAGRRRGRQGSHRHRRACRATGWRGSAGPARS